MNLRRKNRLLIAGAVLGGISLAAGLVLYALSASIDLFYTPEEIHFGKRETGQRPVPGQRLRVGGMVKAGSVKRSPQSLTIAFNLYDTRSEIRIHYTGILPDLFREEQGVVVQGELLPGNVVLAKEVLAKHDENYTPPEVNRAIQDHHHRAGQEAL